MCTGVQMIAEELQRHRTYEGWDPPTDQGAQAQAAACYAQPSLSRWFEARDGVHVPVDWPESWDPSWWKSGDGSAFGRIRELEKAGALIAAELDRLLAQYLAENEEKDRAFAEAERQIQTGGF